MFLLVIVAALKVATKKREKKNNMIKEMTFGEFIAIKRKQAKYTLKELAEILDLSPTYLCNIEHGKRPAPSFEIQVMMACALFLSDEDCFRMFDLAAKTKLRRTIPSDILDYIYNDNDVGAFLRTASKKQLKGKDLLTLIGCE